MADSGGSVQRGVSEAVFPHWRPQGGMSPGSPVPPAAPALSSLNPVMTGPPCVDSM